MLLKTAARVLSLIRQMGFPSPFPGVPRYLRRLLVLVLLFPPFLLLQLVHGLGFLVDELLFRGYRRIEIRAPIFVLGVPRSGTTFMHRLLARDPACTTFSSWECLFAPSIAERYVYTGLAALDRRIGRPLGRLIRRLEHRLLRSTADVHAVSLTAPEEDYLAFLPLLTCFVLVLPFPEADWIWRMGRFDRDVPPAERAWLLAWYRRCLKKHLYFHGANRTMLSKNASFAGMARSLAAEFPDCRLVVCERDAVSAIRSQFKSLEAGLRLFAIRGDDALFRRRLLDCLHFYYENLDAVTRGIDARRVQRASLEDLARNTRAVLEQTYARFGLRVPAEIDAALGEYEARAEPHEPRDTPSLSAWGIDAAEIGRRFAAWRQPGGARA